MVYPRRYSKPNLNIAEKLSLESGCLWRAHVQHTSVILGDVGGKVSVSVHMKRTAGRSRYGTCGGGRGGVGGTQLCMAVVIYPIDPHIPSMLG